MYVGAGWRKTHKKDGTPFKRPFVSISIDHPDFPGDRSKAMMLRVFNNENKKGPNSPDVLIFDDREDESRPQQKPVEVNVEDIPF